MPLKSVKNKIQCIFDIGYECQLSDGTYKPFFSYDKQHLVGLKRPVFVGDQSMLFNDTIKFLQRRSVLHFPAINSGDIDGLSL